MWSSWHLQLTCPLEHLATKIGRFSSDTNKQGIKRGNENIPRNWGTTIGRRQQVPQPLQTFQPRWQRNCYVGTMVQTQRPDWNLLVYLLVCSTNFSSTQGRNNSFCRRVFPCCKVSMAVFTPGKALRQGHYQNGAHCCLSPSVGSYFGKDLALLFYITHKNPSIFYVAFNRC